MRTLFLLVALLASCERQSPEAFYRKSDQLIASLVQELEKVESEEDLKKNLTEIIELFEQFSHLLQRVELYRLNHPDTVWKETGNRNLRAKLKVELNRVSECKEGRKLLLRAQALVEK